MGVYACEPFGTLKDGRQARAWKLRNARGAELHLCDYGARIVSVIVPDRSGRMDDVIMGFDGAAEYAQKGRFNGATCGRYANRIRGAEFALAGKRYSLFANDGPNSLHGGRSGYNDKLWDARVEGDGALRFSYVSESGEEGYPGTLKVEVKYALTEDCEVVIDYAARCDQDTPLNLTNHAFFNLAGHKGSSIEGHILKIFSDFYTPVDAQVLPDGRVLPVEGTPFDFRAYRRVGEAIDAPDEQIRFARGYDHNFILRKERGVALSLAAEAQEPGGGRRMRVYTTEPAIQFYSGNKTVPMTGKEGAEYFARCSFCLETQHYPDSMTWGHFPDPVLRAGEEYTQKTVYAFDAL